MEDFIDQFLSSSSSWMDMNGVQASGMAGDSMGPFQETLKHPTTPSDTLHRLVESNTVAGSPVSLQLNTSVPVTRQGSTSQFLTAVVGPSRTAASVAELASAGSSSSEASGFQQALADPHPPAPVWSESYTVSATLPAAVGQGKVEGFTLKEEIVQGDGHLLGKRSHSEDKMLARENRSADTEHDDLQGTLLTSYTGPQGGQTVLPRTPGAQSHQQNLSTQTIQSGEGTSLQQFGNHSAVSQLQSGAGGGNAANGAARPRVRARRGQATDPHSIAERLRRERIAERMKSLQELVPNSNKTDKASMLDEIIEYVKFLQLQVKVLSMSRLGGAGAVAPLIADVPSQASGGVMSTALGQASGPMTLSQDGLAFEQEVARLMESNMTSAMQYLQNKGLCLMPIALATAISSSSAKPVLATLPGTGIDSSEKQNSDIQSIVLPFSSSSTTMGLRATASGSDGPINENLMNKASIEKVVAEKSNGISPGLSSDVPKVGSQSREELLKRAL